MSNNPQAPHDNQRPTEADHSNGAVAPTDGRPCSPGRPAVLDPDFAGQIARAETGVDVELLGAIRQAAKNDRYRRAAGWLLERRNPHDFMKHPSRSYTPEQVIQLLVATLDTLRDAIPPPNATSPSKPSATSSSNSIPAAPIVPVPPKKEAAASQVPSAIPPTNPNHQITPAMRLACELLAPVWNDGLGNRLPVGYD